MFDGKTRKRPDGRWEIQITIGTGEDGKRIRKSFYGHKEREVIAKKDKWIKESKMKNIGELNSVSDIETFSSWADKWLEIKKITVRPYTYKNTYYTRVEKYLKPYFKQRPLEAITQFDIQTFFLKHQHLSLALLKTLKTILNDMFNKAVMNDLCRKNPVRDIALSSTQKKKIRKALNKEQWEKAIVWATQNQQYDVLTVLKTGIRRGELLGLRWTDVDFDKKIITINQSYCDGIDGEAPDMELKSKSSNRQIPIDNDLVQQLAKIEKTSEYIFPYISAKAYGSHIAHVLKRMANECNIPYVTLHELRHTFGTVLREQDVDIYTISKLLGHSSIGVTTSIYVHNDIEVLRKAMKM